MERKAEISRHWQAPFYTTNGVLYRPTNHRNRIVAEDGTVKAMIYGIHWNSGPGWTEADPPIMPINYQSHCTACLPGRKKHIHTSGNIHAKIKGGNQVINIHIGCDHCKYSVTFKLTWDDLCFVASSENAIEFIKNKFEVS